MRFYVCDLKTGDLIDEYPFQIDQDLERRIGDYRTGTLALPVLDELTPETWRETVLPWRVLIVACDDEDRIIWAGIPDDRETDTGPVVAFPCVTVEKYFDRRYMPGASYASDDQTSVIARGMAEWCGDDVIGIGLDYDTPASGRRRDREYYGDEDARILTRLQQLAAVQDGFEWTIDVEWRDEDRTGIRKIFRTGYPALGRVTDEPEFLFEVTTGLPGPITAFTHAEQWAEGDAATHVQAVGDGEGEDKPYSKVVIDTYREAVGWPRLEERRTQQGVIEQSTLDAYADAMAVTYFGGQEAFEFTAHMDTWPGPGDVHLGDTARVLIDTDQLITERVYRIIGWSLSPVDNIWKPVIVRHGAGGVDDAG